MSDLTETKKTLLVEWEKKRDEYDTLARALRRELGMAEISAPKDEAQNSGASTSTAGLDVNQLVRPGDFFGLTQVDAIQAFLQRGNRQTATLQEIAAALFRGKATETLLEGDRLKNLSSLLSKTEIFFPVARGRWGLAEWYPGKQRTRRSKELPQENGKNETEKASE
jgi:hypothetical protein